MSDARSRDHFTGDRCTTTNHYSLLYGGSGSEVMPPQVICIVKQCTQDDDAVLLRHLKHCSYYPCYRADRRGVLHGDHFSGGSTAPDGSAHAGQRSFLRGRKFGGEELQLLLLNLLRQKPSYGYQLIKQISEKSGGFYTPSPGVVYPALTHMEKVGYIDVFRVRGRKSYYIAPAGEAWLSENQVILDALLAKLAGLARNNIMASPEKYDEEQSITSGLTEVVKVLYSQLHQYQESNEEQKRRVTLILQQTLALLRAIDSG